MIPSMWTSYLKEWRPGEMVRAFAEHGWQALEISDEHGHDLLGMGDPVKVGSEFRAYAADHGIAFPQGHLRLFVESSRTLGAGRKRHVADIAPADDDQLEIMGEEMHRWIDLFNALGVEAGVLHAGGRGLSDAGWSDERIFDRRVEAVARLADYAAGGPTVICLENLMAGSGVATAGELKRMVNVLDRENVAVCLDTGHANIMQQNPAEFARELGPLLKGLHIADNLGKADDHMLPYGRGTIDWQEFMKALREMDWDGFLNLEIPGENHCPESIRLAKLDYALELTGLMITGDGQPRTG